MAIVLSNNELQFGYTCCIKKKGTKMGTPLAGFNENFVMGNHKK